MKGCARSLILYLLGYVAVSAVLYVFVFGGDLTEPGEALPASMGSGFFAWVSLMLLLGIFQTLQERSMIHAAINGEPPVDGRRTVLAGTIDSTGERLRAPLSGTDCVAFKYEVYHMVRGGKTSHKAIHYEGIALIPARINTGRGSYRLLAVPDFDFSGELVAQEVAMRNLHEYIETTSFEQTPKGRTPRPALTQQWNDDDGAYRRDQKHGNEEIPWDKCVFEEHHIRRGEAVCVFGRYSAQKGGLAADPNWAKPTRIMKGNPEVALRRLGGRITGYLIGALVTAAASAAIVWFNWETLRPR